MSKLSHMKTTLIKKHQELTRDKKYEMARLILQFLIQKQLVLALSGIELEISWILSDIGFRTYYHITDSNATVYFEEGRMNKLIKKKRNRREN